MADLDHLSGRTAGGTLAGAGRQPSGVKHGSEECSSGSSLVADCFGEWVILLPLFSSSPERQSLSGPLPGGGDESREPGRLAPADRTG